MDSMKEISSGDKRFFSRHWYFGNNAKIAIIISNGFLEASIACLMSSFWIRDKGRSPFSTIHLHQNLICSSVMRLSPFYSFYDMENYSNSEHTHILWRDRTSSAFIRLDICVKSGFPSLSVGNLIFSFLSNSGNKP